MFRLSTTVLLTGAIAWPSTGQGQTLTKPAPRQGYWLGGGYRAVLLYSQAGNIGNVGPFLGGGYTVRLGEMGNDWLGFGLAVTVAGAGNEEWRSNYGGLSLDVNLKPPISADLTFRLGTGAAFLTLDRLDEAQVRSSDPEGTFGALFTVGASYDLFPFYDRGGFDSGGFAFTIFVEGQALPGDGLLTLSGMAGLEITYFFGLSKNKLDLPPEAAFKRED